ncbi:MAG TPA: SIMPL domain-containing protein [Pyrinomonadaceae bacterium]|nr:SIMPL domain-containing protein [Pyrinomonadaceae bacterium]
MKNILLSLAILVCLAVSFNAQTKPEPRVIEVSGSAERWVTPDEFIFKVTLYERMENKQKVTIEQQEAALRRELSTIGVDVDKALSIYDIASAYVRQKKVKDVLSLKGYRLELKDPNKIARLQEIADRLNVNRLDLIESRHSEITRLRKETKIDAMKAARDKADYLLGSIGQRAGKPVYIREEDEAENNNRPRGANYANTFVVDGAAGPADLDQPLSFSQIKLRFAVTAKFEIE